MAGLLDALVAIGNVADLPASTIRDILMMRNPLDQWAHPISDLGRTTAADLLKRYGLISGKGRGIGNAMMAFGTDVVADPLNILGAAEAKHVPKLLMALRGGA